MEGDGVKSQLLALKKELKCWESMFERKHGRKPSREDIDQSPSEIKDTYRQYQRLKASGRKIKTPSVDACREKPSDSTQSVSENGSVDNEVFGSHLNKQKVLVKTHSGVEEREEKRRGSTWKLRQWTKGEGYRTVQGGGTVSGHCSQNGRTENSDTGAHKTFDREDCSCKEDVTASSTAKKENESTDVDAELNVLSQGITIKTTHPPQKRSQITDGVMNIVQHHRPGSNMPKPRMCHKLSSTWLQRCKPDLSSLSESGGASQDRSYTDTCGTEMDAITDSSVGLGTSKDESKHINDNLKHDNVLTEDCALRDGESFDGIAVDEILKDEHFSSDSEEEVMTEDVLMEEEEKEKEEEKEEEEEEGQDEDEAITEEVERSEVSDEDEEDEEGYGGWDGRLQEIADSSDYIFDPAKRHGDFVPAGNQGNNHDLLPQSKRLVDALEPTQCVLSTALPSTSTLGYLDEKESYVSVRTTVMGKTERRETKWKLQEAGNEGESVASNIGTIDIRPTHKSNKGAQKGKERASTELSGRKSNKCEGIDATPHHTIIPPRVSSGNTCTNTRTLSLDYDRKSSGNVTPHAAASPVFSSSAVSENFVRLNLKVKRFSRKPGGISGSAYKRRMWKKSQRGHSGGSFGSGSSGGGGRGSGGSTCFKCGKPGHWAKDCTERVGSKNLGCFAGEKVRFNENMGLEDEVLDRETLQKLAQESPFPSTKEASLMARGVSLEQSRQGSTQREGGGGDEGVTEDSFQPLPPCRVHSPSPPPPMEPLFPPDQSGNPALLMSTLKKLGHKSFRPGQAETTTRILSGISTLLVQPTGSGKSLCYQLPAYLYSQRSSCITLVISPLVSLMEDQVRQFPACLKGVCLHTNQTQSQRQRIMADVAEGRVDVLLLSPEALVSGAFWSGWNKRTSSHLPPVAFACIDEAHCVSEWSHNFRPSYLRVHKVLRERLGVQCVLGLTATATRTTALSVASHLSVTEENIIRGCTVPSNLHITVSCDENRDDALLQLLQSSQMTACDSIIIYCTRQMETERVAQLLRTSLQFFPAPQTDELPQQNEDAGSSDNTAETSSGRNSRSKKRTRNSSHASSGKKSKKAKLEWSVDSYHAGMSAGERKRIQLAFMTGRLRIVVATVAFGMGLNKSDVRAIIHYNVPKSFESYVQEIGRAGRDGKPAFCHVFIDKEGADLCELRRHAYSSTVDPYSIKQLVTKAFPSCHCKPQGDELVVDTSESARNTLITSDAPKPLGSSGRWCAGHEVPIPIEKTVQVFDTKEECILTLLCYLELQGWLEMKGVKKDVCTLKCYGGPRQLRALAQKVPAVAAATARMHEKGTNLDVQNSISFSSIEVASSMGWESHILRSELRDLQFNDRQTSSKGSGSSVLVEFSDPSFHLLSPGDFSPEELDYMCDYLRKRVKTQETLEVDKLHLLYSVLRSVACDNIYKHFSDEKNDTTQTRLMVLINDYFEDRLDCTTAAERGISVLKLPSEISAELEAEISRDVHSLMSIHSERNFSGRTIARIFHGISSPCFPAEVWAKQRQFWRRHLNVDFNVLCQVATNVTLQILHR